MELQTRPTTAAFAFTGRPGVSRVSYSVLDARHMQQGVCPAGNLPGQWHQASYDLHICNGRQVQPFETLTPRRRRERHPLLQVVVFPGHKTGRGLEPGRWNQRWLGRWHLRRCCLGSTHLGGQPVGAHGSMIEGPIEYDLLNICMPFPRAKLHNPYLLECHAAHDI